MRNQKNCFLAELEPEINKEEETKSNNYHVLFAVSISSSALSLCNFIAACRHDRGGIFLLERKAFQLPLLPLPSALWPPALVSQLFLIVFIFI